MDVFKKNVSEGVNSNKSASLQLDFNDKSSGIDMNLLSSAKATVIFKCAVISTICIFGFFGNVLTLIAIRTTPVLRTKSNRLIAALSVWELFVQGPWNVCFTTYQILAYVVSNEPCRYRTFVAVITPLQKLPFYACDTLFIAITLDRYIAVIYPLHYETVVTETRMSYAIGGCSMFAVTIAIVQLSWLVNINWSSCEIPHSPLMHLVFDYVAYLSVMSVMALVYGRILLVALQHRRKIDQNPAFRLTESSCGISAVVPSTIRTKGTKGTKAGEFKAARMTALVVGSYSISWLAYIVGKGLQMSGNRDQYAQDLVNVGHALGTVNISLDWIIYGMTNRSFRKAYLRILCKR